MNHDDLSLEKLKISERLASLETSVEMFLQENTREHNEIKLLLKKYDENIFGNGKPGLTTKVAKLEDSADNRRNMLIVLFTATAGLIVNRIWQIFEGK
jgi:hypothetical protein